MWKEHVSDDLEKSSAATGHTETDEVEKDDDTQRSPAEELADVLIQIRQLTERADNLTKIMASNTESSVQNSQHTSQPSPPPPRQRERELKEV